jgi:hypothetical protein
MPELQLKAEIASIVATNSSSFWKQHFIFEGTEIQQIVRYAEPKSFLP